MGEEGREGTDWEPGVPQDDGLGNIDIRGTPYSFQKGTQYKGIIGPTSMPIGMLNVILFIILKYFLFFCSIYTMNH